LFYVVILSAAKNPCISPLPLPSLVLRRLLFLFVILERSEGSASVFVVAFAFAFAVACPLPSNPNPRHLDRSNGQSHRPLRSGETPVFRFALAVACTFPVFLVLILREAEDLLLSLLFPLPLSVQSCQPQAPAISHRINK
jgi:hypothetical protein